MALVMDNDGLPKGVTIPLFFVSVGELAAFHFLFNGGLEG